ncbi:MAG: hypothetical protein GY696_13590 [Gammaproteobacteria bacterium]|nr:hypothetical protein [Gammaproteobacteria bacterium]
MNTNRRRHERLEIDHLAELMVGGKPITQYRIRNYSQGGLYLQFDKQNAKDQRPPVNQADNHAISDRTSWRC